MANDKDVVDKFVGDYLSDGNFDPNNPPSKKSWFPKAGVEMSIFGVDLLGQDMTTVIGAYAKVTISESDAKAAIEQAVYRVVGNDLVATDIELMPGLLCTEKLVLQQHGSVLHELEFSDGDKGKWICPSKPKA